VEEHQSVETMAEFQGLLLALERDGENRETAGEVSECEVAAAGR
jgi:hypothetical protein